MKKTKKRILGFLGLVLVVVMTVVAAMMPGPEAKATSETTDTVTIRVLGDTPNVRFTQPLSNIVTTENNQAVAIAYENVSEIKIETEYTDAGGAPTGLAPYVRTGIGYAPGDEAIALDLNDYGYGKFVFTAYGKGNSGGLVPFDSVMITYLPVIASATQYKDSEDIAVLVDSCGPNVEKIKIYLEGELLGTADCGQLRGPVKVSPGDCGTETYTLQVKAYDRNGDELYLPYNITLDYNATCVPDTGNFSSGLNFVGEDYLVAGLIAFFVLGAIAFYIVAKGNKKQAVPRRKKQ